MSATANGSEQPAASGASALPLTPPPPPVEALSAAALAGDLLFAPALPGVDLLSIYATSLAAVAGGSLKAQVARPTARPEDLVRLLAHGDTADLAHSMLSALVIDHAALSATLAKNGWTPRGYLLAGHSLGAEAKAANLVRLPIVGAGLVDALLEDFERRATALAACVMGSGGGGSAASEAAAVGSITSVSSSAEAIKLMATRLGDTAAMMLAAHQLYDGTLLAPRVRAMGFERFMRTCALAIKGAFIACPACMLNVHLVMAFLWGRLCTTVMYYWETCKEVGVSCVMVGDEWAKAMRTSGRAFAEAIVPIALTDNAKVLRSSAWASTYSSVLDDPNVSDAFALSDGLPALLREATDAANRNTTTLLYALSNGARFLATARKAVELGAHVNVQPLIFHDNTKVAFMACHTICLLANHAEVQGAIETTGCLADVLSVLRLLTLPYASLPGGDGFAEPDVAAMVSLCRADNPLALRLCGAMKLGAYSRGAEAALKNGLKDPHALLQRMGIDAVARSLCLDPDAFLYLAGTGLLQCLGLPLPMYRDPSRAAAAAAAASHDSSVLTWSIDDVCAWVGRQPFRAYRQMFREALVDGTSLATLCEEELVDMGIASLLHRKAVRGAIGRLLFRCGLAYEHAVVAASPAAAAAVHGETGEGSGQLLHTVDGADVGLSSAPFTSPSRQIMGRVGGGFSSGGGSSAEGAAEAARKDVFISYRRKTGAVLARLLDLHLRMAGLRTFLDGACLVSEGAL